jgi:hypothetical protein
MSQKCKRNKGSENGILQAALAFLCLLQKRRGGEWDVDLIFVKIARQDVTPSKRNKETALNCNYY